MKIKFLLQISIVTLVAAAFVPQYASASAQHALANQGTFTDEETARVMVKNSGWLHNYNVHVKHAGISAETYVKGITAQESTDDILKKNSGEVRLKVLIAVPNAQDQTDAAYLVNTLHMHKFSLADLSTIKYLIAAVQGAQPVIAAPTLAQFNATKQLQVAQLGDQAPIATPTVPQINAVAVDSTLESQEAMAWGIQTGAGQAVGTVPLIVAKLTSITNGEHDFTILANSNGANLEQGVAATPANIVNNIFKVSDANAAALVGLALNRLIVLSNLQDDPHLQGAVTFVNPALVPAKVSDLTD